MLMRIYEMVAWSNVMFLALGVCFLNMLLRININLRAIRKALESKD